MANTPPDVKSVFGRALEIESLSSRAAYLDQACGTDAGLRAEVEGLLATLDRADEFMRRPAAADAVGFTARYEPVSEGPGAVIGPYKLMEQIGEGGMGLVFVAEQQHPVRRRVALKIIKPGMDSQQVIARFEAERQALAMMDHQNIAKVYDAGTTATGRPYFVMELVHGVPIVAYCDANQLTPRQRLELFIPVCLAIQHAHQKGIIHRDIKPSNVLVTLYDDQPVPKVIDFGVAKATEQRLTEKTVYTQFGTLVGTFEYMSPEQAEMNAYGVDTRSDIYSLGVLLYELLTGTTPLERTRLRQAAVGEIVRLIKEEEPPRPSLRLSTSGSLAKVAAERKTDPAKLSRLVRGELDWVVMKCLEKKRTRRYDSAGGLARDVERYLNDEPIEARPPSAWYRFEKFAIRHKMALMTVGMVAAALVLGTAVSTWQALRATAAEGEARRNELVARDQKRAAELSANAAQKSEELAQKRKHEADDAKDQAERQRDELAQLNENLHRTNYVADMNLARVAWDENNLARTRELLDKYRRLPGEKDLRGFEWHYLHRLLKGEELIVKAHTGWITALFFTPDGKRLISSATDQPPQGMQFFRGAKGEVKQWDASTGQSVNFQLKGQTDGSETLTVFGDRVERIAFSPDGTLMAATCWDHAIRVWDIAVGQLFTLEGPARHAAYGISFSPDGKRLVSAYTPDDPPLNQVPVASLKIWDLTTRKAVVSIDHLRGLRGLFFSPDGKLLAAASSYQSIVKVWDAATGNVAYECKYEGGVIRNAIFNPEGNRLAVCGENGVQIWDAATHQPVATFRSDASLGVCVVYSPDGTLLAMGSIEGLVEIWDTRSAEKVHTFKGHSGNVPRLAFTPDGKRLATGGADGTLRVWDLTGRRDTVSIPKPDGALEFPDLSPDGQTVCTGLLWNSGRDIQLWDTATGQSRGELMRLAKPAISWTWTADSQHFYLAEDGNTIAVVAAASAKLVRTFMIDGSAEHFRFALSADEHWCAYTSGPEAKAIKIQNVQTGAAVRTLTGLDERLHCLLFSPDGSRLLATDRGGTLKLWEVATGREVAMTKLSGIYLSHIAFSPDGKLVAVEGNLSRLLTGEVRVLDAENFREVWTLRGHTLNVTDAAFSPDGQRLATASVDRTIRVWDLMTGQEILKLSGIMGLVGLRFVSDGRRLISATAGRTLRTWDATPLSE